MLIEMFQSGISNIDCQIERKHLWNEEKMRKNLEGRKSDWSPGTQLGYAIFTSGFVADNICRKADARRRGIAQYFRDEIAQPHRNVFSYYLFHEISKYHIQSQIILGFTWFIHSVS